MSQTVLLKAIRAKCLDCCCGQRLEVECCPIERCALHDYRLGAMPEHLRRKSSMSDEQRKAAAERMRAINRARKSSAI